MKAILVANPKGGAGKTTIATNLAGALASGGQKVVLWDLDRQRSSLKWLAIRPAERPRIRQLDVLGNGEGAGQSKGGGWLILDSPAGMHGKNLEHALKIADRIVVPVQPSMFDMAATSLFLQGLMDEKAIRKHKVEVAIVGMRVDPRTRAAATLEAFLRQFDLPVLTYLRDTQVYANAAFNGLSVFDLPEYLAARDIEQWQPLLDWVGQH
ncbi:MAG TPA: ParA family protein [Burkholderiales bacterium]|nr:ParA family protein [Burkholderiales bacterium]